MPYLDPAFTGSLAGGWFQDNAPPMQPGGGGFQEAQAGAVPLPNTGVTGGMIPGGFADTGQQAGFSDVGPPAGFSDVGPMAGSAQSGPQASGSPFAGLMQAGQLGGGMAGQIASGQASPDQARQWFGQQPGGWRGGVGQVMNAVQGGAFGNVLLRAPDGSTKSVPAHQMGHWLSRGAVRF